MAETMAVYDSGIVETEKQVPMLANNFEEELNKMISMAGTIELTEEQKAILYAPVDDDLIEIRPDGRIYLPWMEYVSRLKQTFGLGWQAIPQGMPKFQGNHIYWGYYLVIQGKFAGFSIGEQEYQPKNYGMSYGDAVEGAKSNALMRLCKGVGIGLELWQPSFIKRWKAKYAETYYDQKKQKDLWRRKDVIEQESKDITQVDEQQAKEQAKNEFLEKLRVALSKITTLKKLDDTYEKAKPVYDQSVLINSINAMYASKKKQLMLELLATQTDFSAFQVDAYLKQAGDIGTLIAEVIAGNMDAILEFKNNMTEFINVPTEPEEQPQEEIERELAFEGRESE